MADAPRFRAYFEYAERRPVIHMPRADWDALRVSSSETALIDIAKTPIGKVASDASVVAAYGQRFSTATAEVGVIRLDMADAPNIYNTDKYLVWEDLPSHTSFSQIVAAASTEDNSNLRQYLRENVFIVKQDPDSEHRRAELPNTIKLLMNPSSA
jgi:hypothetical protein